jgi:hypothetical protein
MTFCRILLDIHPDLEIALPEGTVVPEERRIIARNKQGTGNIKKAAFLFRTTTYQDIIIL